MVGIENLKNFVGFGLKMGNAGGLALADGKIDFSDFNHFLAPMSALPAAVQALDDLKGEITDLDEAERKELHQYVIDEFDIPNDKVERLIEKSLTLAWDLYGLILEIGEARKA